MVFMLETSLQKLYGRKNHRVHGQLKGNRKILRIFLASVGTKDAILLLRHAFSCQDMYDIHRFDARKILWRMGIQLKKFTTFYFMTLGSFM